MILKDIFAQFKIFYTTPHILWWLATTMWHQGASTHLGATYIECWGADSNFTIGKIKVNGINFTK